MEVLEKIRQFRERFMQNELRTLGRGEVSAITMADLFERFYTALETLFVEISQCFGNRLREDRWHSDLLAKMTLCLPDVREPALREATVRILHEFLRFRHFRRYYFDVEYDWDKLDFLNKKFDEVFPMVEEDLNHFAAFLRSALEAGRDRAGG